MNTRRFRLFVTAVAAAALLAVSAGPALAESGGMSSKPTVAEIAASSDDFSTLVTAVTAAGLGETLSGSGPFTVFAPTNEAFAAAGEADPEGMEAMMADPTGEFADLLSYHVVEGQLAPDELAGDHETLQGATLTVEGEGESFTVNGSASVVCGDIHTDNATVYVIDEVLHPPA